MASRSGITVNDIRWSLKWEMRMNKILEIASENLIHIVIVV